MEIGRKKVRKLSSVVLNGTWARSKTKVPDPEEEEQEPVKEKTLRDTLSYNWENISDMKITGDLPRLVRRVNVTGGIGDDKEEWSGKEALAIEEGITHPRSISVRLVAGLMKFIVKHVESAEISSAIMQEIDDALAGFTEVSEIENMYVLTFMSIIGRESRAGNVIKLIHQDYVLIATTKLKLALPGALMLKDVRTEDGWQIYITLHKFIQVVHRRREQSYENEGFEHNHFEAAYRVSMTFDKDMQEMTAAQLRVDELDLGQDMDPQLKAKVKVLFADGNLIVS